MPAEFEGFFSGHFVLDPDEMISTIKAEFSRYKKDKGLVIFIFCPKSSRYYEQLARGADFWNRYSDKYVTILFPGYIGYLSCPGEEYHDIVQTEFDYDSFKKSYEVFESNTTWEYRGGTDLLAMVVKKRQDRLIFSYENAIVVGIESLDTDGKFELDRYVVQLINSAKVSAEDPFLGLQKDNALSFLTSLVRFALPENIRSMLDSAVKANLSSRPEDIGRR
jgi:hypothetical protein